jgi:hypothetical protein
MVGDMIVALEFEENIADFRNLILMWLDGEVFASGIARSDGFDFWEER